MRRTTLAANHWLLRVAWVAIATSLASAAHAQTPAPTPPAAGGGLRVYDVRVFGAKGDGQALDTDAINKAIDAAAAQGGGTVYFPPGTYASFSIHLKSNIALYLELGATLLAADTSQGDYDAPEPNASDQYQDFGHSHWRNSLIWGENVHDVAILGPGLIHGKGLSRGANLNMNTPPGVGNKAISLKLARNVTIRDVSMLHAGHFAILATGVDNLTIDNIKIDTNRDGIDVDACRNVRISNVSVNSPWDDAIVLKASFGLGFARATENVTITNSLVSGFREGTLLDATYQPVPAGERPASPTGRIKFGTESNGDFRNITINNIVFDHSRGLALESVDGSHLEDVTISNITMRDIYNAPIFVRLGRRMRAPSDMQIGAIRRVNISNVVVYNSAVAQAALITGIPGHPIEGLKLSNIQLVVQGGADAAQAAVQPPEQEAEYPEPERFGALPAAGFYIRHVNGLELNGVEVRTLKPDARPTFVLEDVHGADFYHVNAPVVSGVATFVLKDVSDFRVEHSRPVRDTRLKQVVSERF